jgi:hypothetical protein
MAGAPPPRPSSASERKKLIEEYEQAKRSEVERHTSEKAEGVRRKKITRAVILGTVLVVLLFLAISPPAWILPPPQPVPTAAEREASIRFSMYLQSQQIEQFRTNRGRLPSTLEEAGPPLPNIQYTMVSGTNYLLRSTANNAIEFNSTDSAHAFLGESMAQLGPSQ